MSKQFAQVLGVFVFCFYNKWESIVLNKPPQYNSQASWLVNEEISSWWFWPLFKLTPNPPWIIRG